MGDNQNPDSISAFRDGANWLVGLSAGAVTAALAYYDKLGAAPLAVRVTVVATVAIFLLSILFGVMYSFHLNSCMNARQRRREYHEKLQADPGNTESANWREKRDAADNQLKECQASVNFHHYASLTTFAVGLLGAASVLGIGLVFGPISKVETQAATNRFYVTSGLMHSVRGKHSHIILIDQMSGETWDLQCSKDGQVEFRRIIREKPNAADVPGVGK
jgi:hypothetical protein